MREVRIAEEDPRIPDVRALLGQHLAYAGEHTRPEDIFALDVDALLDPAVSFFAYRLDGELLGVAALKELGGGHAEVKSMHTAREARRRGVARALVVHLVGVARARGLLRLSLETGAGPGFAAARALYAGAGFEPCSAFGSYRPSPRSAFMTLSLDAPRAGTPE